MTNNRACSMTAHENVLRIHPDSALLSIANSTYFISVAVYEIEIREYLLNNNMRWAVVIGR